MMIKRTKFLTKSIKYTKMIIKNSLQRFGVMTQIIE